MEAEMVSLKDQLNFLVGSPSGSALAALLSACAFELRLAVRQNAFL